MDKSCDSGNRLPLKVHTRIRLGATVDLYELTKWVLENVICTVEKQQNKKIK